MVRTEEEHEPGGNGDAEAGGHSSADASSSVRLAVSLHGDLPCVQCRYQLRGVSILGVCPECGTAVRATLLAVVDPLAAELRPITRPRSTASGLLLWVCGFCLAGLLTVIELVRQLLTAWQLGSFRPSPEWYGYTTATLVLLSGAGASFITRPHDHVTRRETLLGWVGVVLHVPLAILAFALHDLQQLSHQSQGLSAVWEPAPERTIYRLIAGSLGIGIVVCMRPAARALVARSLAIRTGRVDRQTMLATGAAISVIMLGDTLGLAGRWLGASGAGPELLLLLALTLLGFGTLLLLLGLLSSLVDSVRIAHAVVRPGPSMRQVLDGQNNPLASIAPETWTGGEDRP